MAWAARTKPLDFAEMFQQGLNNAPQRPTVYNYKPHDKQILFHSSKKKIRQLLGGNRSGKTVGGIVEDIYHMRGVHPFQKVAPAPTRGRIVCVSRKEGMDEIIIPEIKRWLPPSDLVNGSWEDSYRKADAKLTLSNGSTVELMTYEQEREKFAGTSRHWIHFDEEPPKDIYDECKMRTIDTGGHIWLTMTPLDGMTWTFDEIHMKGLTGEDPQIFVLIVDMEDNPYLSRDEIDSTLAGLDADEIKSRKQGHYVQLGGLVYKNFDPKIHILDTSVDPGRLLSWTQYRSMDHGLNNPTCWLWHAVNPKGMIITFDEIYQNETLISEFAHMIKERDSREGRRFPDLSVGDPSIAQRSAINKMSIQQMYAIEGIPIILGNNDVPVGVEKINSHLRAVNWFISPNCKMLIREMSRLRWKTYETAKKRHDNNPRPEIHKKNDHAPDAARYFFGLMPDLRLPNPVDMNKERVNKMVQEALGAHSYRVGQNIDWNLRKPKHNTEWTQVDEHLGGIW